ncbi:MAG: 16S rRNA (guanine(527)-N(7))-methyltransferase RsmG [Phycisphaerae bacterium]|nr:16S rRNA (guanine(527)-N(7))-methyltransferase RsmG [Phycisphaerae bacterium]
MTVPEPNAEFVDATRALGIELESGDLGRLGDYLERLYRANETMNLTRVPPDAAWMRHVVDSLTLVPWLASIEPAAPASGARLANDRERAGPSILDVGSGGGLPGIVLAIVLSSIVPEARVTLLEATGKKARFLHETARALELSSVRVVTARAESAAQERDERRHPHREGYDAVVCRAVATLPVLVELTLPFVRPGGFVMAIKGERAASELEEARHAIGLLGGAFVESKTTPTGTLLRIEKVSRTPRTYPRHPGEPARRPLLAPRDRSKSAPRPPCDPRSEPLDSTEANS